MHTILETAIRLERLAATLRQSVSMGKREMLARDIVRVTGISFAMALTMVDRTLEQNARKILHDIVKPLL